MPRAILVIAVLLAVLSVSGARSADRKTADAILAQERSALDRWAKGDPMGYPPIDAEDVTYFDDIAAQTRIEGREAMRSYFASLTGKIPPHQYEIVSPKVQVYGDVGILTLRYETRDHEGKPLTPWKATSVYRRVGREWRIVHAHWSKIKT